MPLSDPFARRIALIRSAIALPPFRVLELTRPPDLQVVVQRLLARMADEPNDLNAFVYLAPTFESHLAFFKAVVSVIAANAERARADLTDLGIEMPQPPELAEEGEDEAEWARQTAEYLSVVADSMPEGAGSLVLILEPPTGALRRALGWSLGALAWYLRSDRMKIVVVHGLEQPLIPPSGGVEERTVRIDFSVSPEELEVQVLSDLDSGELEPAEARRYGLLAGAFSSSAGRLDEAEQHLREAVRSSRAAEERGEEANALYNLGNLHIRSERFEEASESFADAASAAMESENLPLSAMALTNLGVALFHEGRQQEAVDSFGAARSLFKALDHRPGEAHVLDCTARTWAYSDPERARGLWTRAAALYESIEAPHLQEVKAAGLSDIEDKIRRLGRARVER